MIKRAERALVQRVEAAAGSLTPGEKRIADILLANPHEAAFLGVEELARRSDSSVATAVRFAKKLGYKGYLEMRKSLVTEARRHYRRGDQLLLAPSQASETLVEVARRDVRNIELVVNAVNEKLLLGAVQRIIDSRIRLALGDGVSALMARHLAYLLINAGVPAMEGNPSDFATQVGNLDSRDLVIAISIAPYSRETLDAAAYAKKRGVPVVAFTDRLNSPLARSAVLTLPVPGENLLYSHSLAAFGVVAHAIATLIASQDAKGALQRMREVERVASSKFADE